MKIKSLWAITLAGLTLPIHAAPLIESTFTEVVNEVNIVANGTESATPAKINNTFNAPDLVRTGPDSRAELTAPDQTITRVGANSVFSFEPARRNLRLEQGNVLFHPPAGAGGGTITSGGTTAAVLGTTLIVSATANGGFKVILLEGRGKVTLSGGKSVTLRAGQLVFVQPGGKTLSPVLDINLAKLVAGSLLVNGFSHPLSSLPLIQAAIKKQDSEIASGNTVDTGLPPDNFGGLDHGSYQIAAPPPLSEQQYLLLTGKPSSPAAAGAPPGGTGGRGVGTVGSGVVSGG